MQEAHNQNNFEFSKMAANPHNSRVIFARSDETKTVVEEYIDFQEGSLEDRQVGYKSMICNFYDLVTNFYEFAWGQSFHFAPRNKGESFKDSLLRHQRFLGDHLSLKPGFRVIDLGCGVGGPLRNIARWYESDFVGLNLHSKQIERAKVINKTNKNTSFITADFMNVPEEDESFDAAYSIEAMCHAPDKIAAFREVWRILKPGSFFGGYDWCINENFDPANEEHMQIKKNIMLGNALPDIASTTEVSNALKEAGFELIKAEDVAYNSHPNFP